MDDNQKREKVLAMAASHGVPMGLYSSTVDALTAEGRIELRATFSKVGARGSRYFLKAVA